MQTLEKNFAVKPFQPERTNSESIAYFDRVAPEYFQRYREQSPAGYAFRVRKQRVVELFDQYEGRLLDVGCGPGIMAEELIALGFEFWGMDASAKMIKQCRRNFGALRNAHFSTGNVLCMEFPEGFFDVVICMGVIDRISAYDLAIGEMLRVLKKNGVLLISFPNFHSPWAAWRNFIFYPLMTLLRPLYYGLIGRPRPAALTAFAKMYTAKSASRLMRRYGGEVTNVAYLNFNLLLSPLDEIFPRLAMRITEKLESWHSGKLNWLGSGFILKIRKIS